MSGVAAKYSRSYSVCEARVGEAAAVNVVREVVLKTNCSERDGIGENYKTSKNASHLSHRKCGSSTQNPVGFPKAEPRAGHEASLDATS